jgi:hypothetical protein
MQELIQRLCRCRKNPKLSDRVSTGSQKRRDFGQSYVEHLLNLEELADIFADSFIDSNQPDQSDGLSCVEAQ